MLFQRYLPIYFIRRFLYCSKMTDQKVKDRFVACMVLHGVGDSMGYRRGDWEFCYSTRNIHEQLKNEFRGKIKNIRLDENNWPVSDDTVMHLANAKCLIENPNLKPGSDLYRNLIQYYKSASQDMSGRAPGNTTMYSIRLLDPRSHLGYRIPFNPRGGGCGASMRSSCIGLRYSKPEDLDDLIAFSIESGRMTHHLPLGYLGGLVAALFTSYAIQGKRIENWGIEMIDTLDKAKEYIKKEGYCVDENLNSWSDFRGKWLDYLKTRKLDTLDSTARFPDPYGIKERDEYYNVISNGRWAGATGLDSVIIAYDALLGSKDNWSELCLRAMLHGGDSDSTGCIAGSWYGALYGFKNVYENNYETLEYRSVLEDCGKQLYRIAFKYQMQCC